MGLTNNSPYTFKSGPTCTGTYMRVNTPCIASPPKTASIMLKGLS